MDLIDKLFVINLEERSDRLEHFLTQCKIHSIPDDKIERFAAVNGKTHLFTKEELGMFKKSDFMNDLTPLIIKKKLMGNQLSHLNILLEMKKRNYNNIIILQDDVILKHGFINYIKLIMDDLPTDAEIINFGLHKTAICEYFEPYDLDNEIIDNNIVDKQITNFVYLFKTFNSLTRYRVNPASLAYIVTKKGCDNLLEHFYKRGFDYATDWNYNLYLQSKNIFYGSKYILATGNNIFKSDVFVDTNNYSLEDLIDTNVYYTDKNTTHSYFNSYNELFTPIRKIAKNILEIGIGNFSHKNGGSLLLWKLFFKNASIHGVDIVSESRVYDIILRDNNIETYLNTDAYGNEFVETFKKNNILFDVIIDDGPHTFESQCKCIELYCEMLSDNGILVIEDVQDINWINKFKNITPLHLQKYIHVYDLRNVKNRYDDILFVINKNIPNNKYNDINIPLVLSYENDLSSNKNAQLFKKTLDHHKWEHEFIGEGIKWNGFHDKIIGYYDFLTNNLLDNKIVILSDARDVFCLKNSDFFIEQIKPIIQDKIIISTEMFLIGHMDWSDNQIKDILLKDPQFFWQGVPLNEYWEYHKINSKPFRKYLNSGLIVGKTKNIKKALKWIIDNNINDDQLGFSKYTNQFPNLVHLDVEANILHTSTAFVNGSFYRHDIQKLDMPTFDELLGLSNYFLHIPGSNISKGQDYIYRIIYSLFNSDTIDKNLFDLYNLQKSQPIQNSYFGF
jgi:GR25 family glycosyltransferase involved in LPS biosynthesis